MSELIMVTMSAKDIDPMLKIEQVSFKHPWSRLFFLNELSNKYSHNFVLKLENSCETYPIFAYLCFRLIIDEIHILKIAVHQEQRCRGFAGELLKHCLFDLREQRVRSATLEVRESTRPAVVFIKKPVFILKHKYQIIIQIRARMPSLCGKLFKRGI